MSWDQFVNGVVALVALYGAVLSTINFVAQRRRRRPSVTVNVSTGFFTYPVGPPISQPMLLLNAANTGEKSVILSSFGLQLPDGRQLFITDWKTADSFPLELAPGRGSTVGEEMCVIAQSLAREGYRGRVKLTGFFRDQVGTEYASKPCPFEVEAWLREAG